MPDTVIQIDPQFKFLIPPLSRDELSQLEANLLDEGCRDRLVVWRQSGILLDGHHRHELCQRHGIPFQLTLLDFADRDAAMQWAVLNQFARRNLNDDQRAILAARLREITTREAKRLRAQKAGRAKGKNGNLAHTACDKIDGRRDTRQEAAQRLHVPRRKLERALRLIEVVPELAEQVLKGKLKLIFAERQAEAILRDRARAEAAQTAPRGSHVLTGDFRIFGKRVADSSVDLILTDPPYPGEFIDLYRDLSAFAARVLRAGGLCVAYSGTMFLPDVINRLSEHLKYVC